MKYDIYYYTRVCDVAFIVKIQGCIFFSLSIILNIKFSIQMLFVKKIHCATKAKPAGKFIS